MRFAKMSPVLAAGAFAAALVFSVPVQARDSGEEKTEEADPDKMVCKREAVVGTRIKKRRCLTQAQWDRIARDAQEAGESMQRRAAIDSASDGP